ncbi:MAG: PASTA domain-containing protein [Trueperaceae bacterium]
MNGPPRPRPPARRRWLLLALAWSLVIGIAVVTFAVARGYFEVPETRTPSVTGLTLADASREVRAVGLRIRSYPVEAPGAQADVVVEQAPPAGNLVREGRTIDVGVHVQAESNRMPALVGANERDAVATLRSVGFPPPDVNYVRTDGPSGRVVTQRPAPGSGLASGERVVLEVGRGPRASDVEVPDVSGLQVDSAVAQLTALGLRSIETVAVGVSSLRPGTVVQQHPEPGTEIAAGEPVTLGYALEGSRVAQVPDLTGMEPALARVSLSAAGLRLGPVEVTYDPDRPQGVLETLPSGTTVAGAFVALVVNAPEGSEVDLGPDPDRAIVTNENDTSPDRFDSERELLAGGNDDDGDGEPLPEGARRVPFHFDPSVLGVRSLMQESYQLRLVVRDDSGERDVLQRQVPGGEAVDVQVVVHGDEALLQTYVNGVFFQAWRP